MGIHTYTPSAIQQSTDQQGGEVADTSTYCRATDGHHVGSARVASSKEREGTTTTTRRTRRSAATW